VGNPDKNGTTALFIQYENYGHPAVYPTEAYTADGAPRAYLCCSFLGACVRVYPFSPRLTLRMGGNRGRHAVCLWVGGWGGGLGGTIDSAPVPIPPELAPMLDKVVASDPLTKLDDVRSRTPTHIHNESAYV
jgi:hypothetical protein